MRPTVRATSSGRAYLNVGCGGHYHPEWNNVDLYESEYVAFHDLRSPLPYDDRVFDAVYSSHVLEHLTPEEGGRLVGEMGRVLKPGGVLRLAVPDLERICEEYLLRLREVADSPSVRNRRRYEWVKMELFDQMVREVSGGQMVRVLRAGDFDPEYVEYRNGEEFSAYYPGADGKAKPTASPAGANAPRPRLVRRLLAKGPRGVAEAVWWRFKKSLRKPRPPRPPDPRLTGEAHKWMYDRVALQMLLEERGFVGFRVCRFDESRVADWGRYRLDNAATGDKPRKPDSLFVEATKPATA